MRPRPRQRSILANWRGERQRRLAGDLIWLCSDRSMAILQAEALRPIFAERYDADRMAET